MIPDAALAGPRSDSFARRRLRTLRDYRGEPRHLPQPPAVFSRPLTPVRHRRTMARRGTITVILRLLLVGAIPMVPFAGPTLAAFTQELYVWQRSTGPAVAAALREFAPQCDGFNVLAAEVSWRNGSPHITRTTLDYATLASLGRPVGLSLRVGAFAGPFAEEDAAAKMLAALAIEMLAAARRHGLEPAELQIDFDCAESKLAGYRNWLTALRTATDRTPLVFTALPAWLGHRDEFAALAAAAYGFVLQVHSLEKPTGPDAPFSLCDPERARRWIRQADEVGRPFRVALPTYGYTLAFDRAGTFLSLAAEGPRPNWPAGAQRRIVRSDPVALAALVRELRAQPPPHCTGLLWFRLPVAGDRLNWDAATLATVLRGETPTISLLAEATWPAPGLVEVVVRNTGQTSEPLPATLALTWSAEMRASGGDSLVGYRLSLPTSGGAARLDASPLATEALLPPGRTAKVAWLRFAHEIPLTVQVVPSR